MKCCCQHRRESTWSIDTSRICKCLKRNFFLNHQVRWTWSEWVSSNMHEYVERSEGGKRLVISRYFWSFYHNKTRSNLFPMSGEIYAYFYNVQSQTFQESSVQEVLQLWVLPEAARLMVLKVSRFKHCWVFWGISRTLSSLQVSHFLWSFNRNVFEKQQKTAKTFAFRKPRR